MAQRDIIVIGASAGGIPALIELTAQFEPDMAASVFIVQHIPAYRDTQLDQVLAKSSALPVSLARDSALIQPGTIYVAPNDHHLMLVGNRMRLTAGPRENRVRPCADVLFRSAAIEYGPRVIGIVLSGTLDDGTAGLWAIKDRGGITMVQDPSTAEYPDMPTNAIGHVDIDFTLDLRCIAQEVARLSSEAAGSPMVESGSKHLELENMVALEGNALKAGVLSIGELSPNTCPECHGVLVKLKEGSISRYRCHTGHAYSLESLLVDVDEAVDRSLWAAIRAIEERSLILREMASLERGDGASKKAELRAKEAEYSEGRAQRVREMIIGPSGQGPS